MLVRVALLFLPLLATAQTICQPTPRYTPCDLVFDIPNTSPDKPVELRAEFRSPRARTALMNAFSDGGTRWIIRYTPTEAGSYDFRLTSKITDLNGKTGSFTALPNKNPGWLRAANLHHFAYVDEINLTPHLWMGAVVPNFPSLSMEQWRQLVDTRAGQHFNHLAVTLVDQSVAKNNAAQFDDFRDVEAKIRYANEKGILVDVAFFAGNNLVNTVLNDRAGRAQWFENAISRLAAFDITWQGIEAWETYPNGRELLREIGDAITKFDPYKHTRSSRTNLSTAPLVDDGWLRYRSYSTTDAALEAVDHQAFQYPAVNNFTSTAGNFRRDLWTATMNGQYPSPLLPNEANSDEMKIWYEFMASTRHWELEPFFDLDNGRALAYDGVEYIVYVDKPGPVNVNLEKHKYDIEWFNPANGERVKVKAERIEVFNDAPPDAIHDWVLHISREGHKAGMLKSFKFDSREEQPALQLQLVEADPAKVPYEIELPNADTLSLSKPVQFKIKLKRETKATKKLLVTWTGEVTVDNQSFRVLGTGLEGTLNIPADIARNYPAALHIKVSGLNGLGKLYSVDRNYTLTK